MLLGVLRELGWKLYQNGKASATNQNLTKADIGQKCKLLFADAMRQRYYESKQRDDFGQPDYSFSSPVLSVKRFELPEANDRGVRRCDMSAWDMYRLPGNTHIPNVYPIGKGCKNDQLGEITQVNPGEENFYANDPDMSDFQFFVIKGRGLDTYHVPPCINALDVEATFDVGDDTDIEDGIASNIIDQILEVGLGIKKQYYSEEVKKQMAEQNLVK